MTPHLRSIVPNVQQHMAYFARVTEEGQAMHTRAPRSQILVRPKTTPAMSRRRDGDRVAQEQAEPAEEGKER
jgi:hypothetical protein